MALTRKALLAYNLATLSVTLLKDSFSKSFFVIYVFNLYSLPGECIKWH